MSSITDIKRRITELSPAGFQEFCDALLFKKGYGIIHGYGMKAGTGKTTIGVPDAYFRKENGKYVFVAYTTQQEGIYDKLKCDIEDCLDLSKTLLESSEIEEVICCHTSSNLSAGEDKDLHDICELKGIKLTICGVDEIANLVVTKYRSLIRDYLGLSIDTNQILDIFDFVKKCDANGMSAPLGTTFLYREGEKREVVHALTDNKIVLLTGKAGVGKTRLALEVAKELSISKGYKLLCIKSNNLPFYEDLISSTEQPGKYLFLIDDANELADIKIVFEYITKDFLGYDVKILLTLRDYAKEQVISLAEEFVSPLVINLLPFSDEQITGFLDEILGIKNGDYVNQIIRIAEGNPRMAYMAGRLAVEEERLDAIADASQLYGAYYRKYISDAFGNDEIICRTAGILAIIRFVELDDLSPIQGLFEKGTFSVEEFKDAIYRLEMLEFVEIHSNKLAILSDQSFANYMLYYVFFQKKILSLSEILETGYSHFRKGVLYAVDTILKIFGAKETREYCKEEVLKAWGTLEKSQESIYEQFVRDFHVFKPECGFIYAKRKLDEIKQEEFDGLDVDFSENCYSWHKEVLQFLTGYQYTENVETVLELLLEYCSKSKANMVTGYKWIEDNYGIEKDTYLYKYCSQLKISQLLYDAVKKGNKITLAIAGQWAKYSLSFSFQYAGLERGNKVTFYRVGIKNSEELRAYRRVCWDIIIALASRKEWEDKSIVFLNEYAGKLTENFDSDIAADDVEKVERFLKTIECDRISFLGGLNSLCCNAKKIGVLYDSKWNEKFGGECWRLYKLIKDDYLMSGLDYEAYKVFREKQIVEYAESIDVAKIPTLVSCVNEFIEDKAANHNIYFFNEALEMMLKNFDDEKADAFLKAFFQYGKSISVGPQFILDTLIKKEEPIGLLRKIQSADFPQKNGWLFTYFQIIPRTIVDNELLSEFLAFLASDADKQLKMSPFRNLRLLDKFIGIEPNIYPIACSIIYEKRSYSGFVVSIYCELLFNSNVYGPKELITLFRSDLVLLQELYFFMLENGRLADFDAVFFEEFLSLGDSWLHKYSKIFWNHIGVYNESEKYRCLALWESEKYMEYYDYLFYSMPENEKNSCIIENVFSRVFLCEEGNIDVKMRQTEWLTHIVVDNIDSEWLTTIFDMACELDETFRKSAIEAFLVNNSDFQAFLKIRLLPASWSGTENFIPAYKRQIGFLESLYPFVSGTKYLKHKARIQDTIRALNKQIEKEEIETIRRHQYM